MATLEPLSMPDDRRGRGAAHRRRVAARFVAVMAVVLLVVLAAFTRAAGAQEEAQPGLDCDSDTPSPGDTLACEAGGLEEGKGFSWTATFAEGEPLTDEGTVDENSEAHFELTVPDAPGEFEVTLDSDGNMDPDADYTFTGTVQASEEGPEDEPEDTTAESDDTDADDTTTTTTTTTDEVTIVSESDDTEAAAATEADDAELAASAGEPDDAGSATAAPVGQVEELPAGGVATGVGPPADSGLGTLMAVAMGLVTVTAVVLTARRRARRETG